MYLLLDGVPPHVNGGTLEDLTGGELADIWTPAEMPDAIGAVIYPSIREQASVVVLMREARELGIDAVMVRVNGTCYRLDTQADVVVIERDGQPAQTVSLV